MINLISVVEKFKAANSDDMPTKGEIAAVLGKLTWKVGPTKYLKIGDKFEIYLICEGGIDDFFLGCNYIAKSEPTVKRKQVPLNKEDVYTKGKSGRLRDNQYRLTPEAVAKWAEDLEKAFKKIADSKKSK